MSKTDELKQAAQSQVAAFLSPQEPVKEEAPAQEEPSTTETVSEPEKEQDATANASINELRAMVAAQQSMINQLMQERPAPKERKTERVGLLMRPSVLKAAREGARKEHMSFNAFAEHVFCAHLHIDE